MSEFKDLDPVLHSQLRLAVVSLLISVEGGGVYVSEGEDGCNSR